MLDRRDHPAPASGRRVTPAQVVGIGLVAASLAWAAWLLRDRPISEEVELLPGTVLPSSELAIVEAAFDRGQLTDHRTEAGRVWVPRQRQSAYMRALVDAEALPREFGSSLRRALEKNSPWQSRAVQEEMLRVAVQEELAHVICSMPGIERAAVLYDVEERSGGGLSAVPSRTASVNIRTQADVELEPARVQAIRVLVAASIAGLDAEQVAVTDLRSGQVFAGPLASDPTAAADPELARRIAHERHLQAKVRQAVSFIRGAVVDVTVTFAMPPTDRPRLPPVPPVQGAQQVAGANTPAEVGTPQPAAEPAPAPIDATVADSDAPATILVSLAVPEAFLRDERAAGEAGGGLTEDQLRDHVLALLPPTRLPSGRRVTVTRYSERLPGTATLGPVADAPAEQAAAGPELAGRPVSLEAAWKAMLAGQGADVPREIWLGVIAVASAVLGWLVLRPQATGAGHVRPRRRAAAVDFTGIEPGEDDRAADASRPSGRREAA